MAAIEVTAPAAFDIEEFTTHLVAQDDLGAKAVPRLLRVSAVLPVTGSGKVLKRALRQQRWHTGDLVYRWAGRGEIVYRPMPVEGKEALDAEFHAYGRQRCL